MQGTWPVDRPLQEKPLPGFHSRSSFDLPTLQYLEIMQIYAFQKSPPLALEPIVYHLDLLMHLQRVWMNPSTFTKEDSPELRRSNSAASKCWWCLLRIAGSVQTLDWKDASERAQACSLLEKHASGSREGPTSPLLIKGAVIRWQAIGSWSLSSLKSKYPNLR